MKCPQFPGLSRWLADEGGQDLIEYALLSGFIGLAAVAVFNTMTGSMEDAYEGWSTEVQSDALVEMPCPVSECP